MRLVDADALIKDITNSADLGGELGKVVEVVKAYAKFMVASAPTIQSAQPKTRCVAKITITDEQVKEILERAKAEILDAQPDER